MKRRRFSSYLFSAFAIGVALEPASGDDSGRDEALVRALRDGGFNLYFRHAATDWSQSDHIDAPGDWSSCNPERVRQLSASGRATASRVLSLIHI